MRKPEKLFLLVAAVTFASFAPALGSLFVNWDDTVNFINNPGFRGLGVGQLRWMATARHMGHYQPVSWLTYGLDYVLWGSNPFGYHLTSLLLHCANAFLACLLGRELLERGGMGSPEVRVWAAAFGGLAFAVHPLRVEAVAWATERREVLAALFGLLATLTYVGRGEPTGRRLAAAHVLAGLAMLSNVRAVSLVPILLVLDWYPLGRGWTSRRVWLEKLPLAAVAGCVVLAGFSAQTQFYTLHRMLAAAPLARAAQVCFGAGFFAWKTTAPWGLGAWYGASYMSARLWVAGLGGLCLVGLTALLFAQRRARPAVWAAWLVCLLGLAPSLGLVKSGDQVAADRYSYLPALPLALLAAAGLARLWTAAAASPPLRRLAGGLAVGLVAAWSALTWRQSATWNDSLALWSNAHHVDPSSVYAVSNLGLAMFGERRFNEAARLLETIRPESVEDIDPSAKAWFFEFNSSMASLARSLESQSRSSSSQPAKPSLRSAH